MAPPAAGPWNSAELVPCTFGVLIRTLVEPLLVNEIVSRGPASYTGSTTSGNVRSTGATTADAPVTAPAVPESRKLPRTANAMYRRGRMAPLRPDATLPAVVEHRQHETIGPRQSSHQARRRHGRAAGDRRRQARIRPQTVRTSNASP